MKQLLEKLKEERKAANITQRDMAEAVDMERETYTRIERGKQGTTVSTMQRIGEVLGLTLAFVKKNKKANKNLQR